MLIHMRLAQTSAPVHSVLLFIHGITTYFADAPPHIGLSCLNVWLVG